MESSEFVRENFIEPAQDLYVFCNEVYTEVEKACKWLDRNVDAFAKIHLPPNAHHLAMSIFRTLPEAVVCGAACMSGASAVPAVIYLATRVVVVSLPHVRELLDTLIDAKLLGDAIGKTAKELFATYKNFRPAIAMCAAIATVGSFVFGWATGNISLVMRSPLYAIVTYLAVADILRDAEAAAVQLDGEGMPPRDAPRDRPQVDSNPLASAAGASASAASAVVAQPSAALPTAAASSPAADAAANSTDT